MANTFSFSETLPDVSGAIDFETGNGFSFAQTLALGPSGFRMFGNVTASALNAGFPSLSAPMVDPTTGIITPVWQRFFLALWTRTGGAQGALSR